MSTQEKMFTLLPDIIEQLELDKITNNITHLCGRLKRDQGDHLITLIRKILK